MDTLTKKRIKLRTGLFSSQTIEFSVRYSKRSKKSRIKVDIEGIEVILPESMHSSYAEKMMHEYADWVMKKVALFDEIRKRQLNQTPGKNNELLYHGKLLKVVQETMPVNGKAGKIRISGSQIILPNNGFTRAKKAQLIQDYLRDQSRSEISSLAYSLSQKMGSPFTRLTIRDQRTRWGACSARKSLSFNWRLVMAPPEVAEYVVVHELAHLQEMNHSIHFWKFVEKFCPDYKKRRQWLKKNGHLLRPDFISMV